MRTDREQPVIACVGLGSNVGDRRGHLVFAFEAIEALPETWLVARSTIIETDPVGPPGQGAYLNAAAQVATTLDARTLLDQLLEIERVRERDRAREQRWGPRTLDLDLLLYGDAIIDEPGLEVPHPRLAERLFVLEPLAEIAPDAVVPGAREKDQGGRTVAELLRDLRAAKGPAS